MALSIFLAQDLMNTRTKKNKLFTKIKSAGRAWGFERDDMLISHPLKILDIHAVDVSPEFAIILDDRVHLEGVKPSIIHSDGITDIDMKDYLHMGQKLKEAGLKFNKKTRKIISCTR